jgi:hypothetical protein
MTNPSALSSLLPMLARFPCPITSKRPSSRAFLNWVVCVMIGSISLVAAQPALTFHKDFEGGSLGRVEQLGETNFRVHVEGQSDEHGRNRQANWYYFRLDGARGREVVLTLTDFIGEYNLKPACAMNADTVPVFSEDGEHWQHFAEMQWNKEAKEATLRFRPERDSFWIAHVPPYLPSRLNRLLAEAARHPCARIETIGQTVQGRPLQLVTVTNHDLPADHKKTVWIVARQHAWETGTSFVMEGALRFLVSDDPQAAALRDRVIFQLVPMMDPDGCVNGTVRFNANHYDVNRHWDEVNPPSARLSKLTPEIAAVKGALLACLGSGRAIDLVLNLHNEESGELLETAVDDKAAGARIQRLDEELRTHSTFDPSRPLGLAAAPGTAMNCLWNEHRIPVVLMEQRISTSPKLGRRPTSEDRLTFGAQLVKALAASVLTEATAFGSKPQDAWTAITSFFQPPAPYAGQLGHYRSPLLFNNGSQVASTADWSRRRAEILRDWQQLMGPWPPLIEKPQLEVLREQHRDNFAQRRIRLEIAPHQTGEGWLLVPDGAGPFPAVLVVYYEPDTSVGLGQASQPEFGLQLARRGFVTLSIGTPGGNAWQPELGVAHCQPLSFHAYVAANCWQALANRPEVDPARIGIVGHSYGGKWALFAGALWDKFACVAVSDPGVVFDESRPNVNYWEPWYLGFDPEQKRPQAGVPTADNPRTGAYKKMVEAGRDLHELHALIAPRPFFVSGGSEDPPERWLALNHAVAVNQLLGCTNRVALTHRQGHTPTDESNAQLYSFFEHFLNCRNPSRGLSETQPKRQP